MMAAEVDLREWETASPAPGSVLGWESFGGDRAGRAAAESLTKENRMQVLELVKGLEIRATSFVGKLQLGPIEITIRPKLSGTPLLNLLRYAYGLRDLSLHGETVFSASAGGFQDLLIQQLAMEAQELISRGLHRDYISVTEDLSGPRGRIDFARYLGTYVRAGTSLPCMHNPRSEDNLLNRVLLAGLVLSESLTSDRELRFKIVRLSKRLEESVSTVELDQSILREAWWAMDRRTKSYESAVTLIELLVDAAGASFSGGEPLQLSGFLFDMNRFFQALLSRFLREHLRGFDLEDERRLNGTFAYDPQRNPQFRRAPTPRPDFVVLRDRKIVAVLDAKYRDLWERTLPESMLYQLSIYALCHSMPQRAATILYPTLEANAAEQSIFIKDAFHGSSQAQINLRPVNLLLMDKLLQNGSGANTLRQRQELAIQLAFGNNQSTTIIRTSHQRRSILLRWPRCHVVLTS